MAHLTLVLSPSLSPRDQVGRKMLHIVMEFADGGDLSGRIKAQNGRMFPESTVLSWFVQICLAVKHIHDRKIIHRSARAAQRAQ